MKTYWSIKILTQEKTVSPLNHGNYDVFAEYSRERMFQTFIRVSSAALHIGFLGML